MDDSRPIFLQIAERIESDIITGVTPEESQVPSINEFAAFYRINPATALKGVNLLVDQHVLYKRRGIGMFVATGARDRVVTKRRERLHAEFIGPLIAEAARLGLSPTELVDMIRKEGNA